MGLYVRVNNPFSRDLLPPKTSHMSLWPEFCHMPTPKPDIISGNRMTVFHLDWSRLTTWAWGGGPFSEYSRGDYDPYKQN